MASKHFEKRMRNTILWISVVWLMGVVPVPPAAVPRERVEEKPIDVDVLVYGATPAGILSAFAVRRDGRSVIIVEPSRWVGGILGAGLKPTQDMPNYEAVGGKTRELVLRLGVDPALKGITLEEVIRLMPKMSPRDIRESFLGFLKEHAIRVIFDHRISRTTKKDQRLQEALFDLAPFDAWGRPVAEAQKHESLRIQAKVFIDASYDGELMARSGVSYRVGRESQLDYDEELAGVLPLGGISQPKAPSVEQAETILHGTSNLTPINPFVDPKDRSSGLIPLVEQDHGKRLGAGDHYTQAYNFRFYVTADPTRRAPILPPDHYDPAHYELVGRYVAYLIEQVKDPKELFERLSWIFPGWQNEGEYNYQRRSLITIAPLGISHLYANGDYSTKARIWKEHQDYLRGLYHFLVTDKRVPRAFREQTARLGLDKVHHPDTHGWPHQLYIRVSRRLMGRYTITAHDVYDRLLITDPVGLAQYGVDTYPSRRIWVEKGNTAYVATEGNMFVGGYKGPRNAPYPIPYRAITPQTHECKNLLVPVAFSASHLGYASARMEPTFMIVGESAGIAATQALEERVAVQDIDLGRYLNKLHKVGQRLDWDERTAPSR